MRTVRLLPVSPSMHCSRGGAGTPPVNRMTNRCKYINLLQTSFAGGKYFSDNWTDSDVIAYCRVPVMYCKQPFIDDSKFKIDQLD